MRKGDYTTRTGQKRKTKTEETSEIKQHNAIQKSDGVQ